MKKKFIYSFFIVFIFPFSLFAQDTKNQNMIYRIAVVLPLTGEKGIIGKNIREGMETYFLWRKNNGELDKFNVRITIFDTESEEKNATIILDYLEKNASRFFLLAGGTNEREFERLFQIATNQKIPYLSPFRVTFREKMHYYYFPIFPSLFSGFKFAMKFFDQRNIEYKIIYDESTKQMAFMLAPYDKLLAYESGFENKLARVSILFLGEKNLEDASQRIGKKSIKVLNFHNINQILSNTKPELWEGSLLVNWVKGEKYNSVKQFQEIFASFNSGKEADNLNMLGWIFADLLYQTFQEIFIRNKDIQEVTREQFIAALENFGTQGGYDAGCGYKIFYSSYMEIDFKTRLGISGMYFMRLIKGKLELISDFFSLYE